MYVCRGKDPTFSHSPRTSFQITMRHHAHRMPQIHLADFTTAILGGEKVHTQRTLIVGSHRRVQPCQQSLFQGVTNTHLSAYVSIGKQMIAAIHPRLGFEQGISCFADMPLLHNVLYGKIIQPSEALLHHNRTLLPQHTMQPEAVFLAHLSRHPPQTSARARPWRFHHHLAMSLHKSRHRCFITTLQGMRLQGQQCGSMLQLSHTFQPIIVGQQFGRNTQLYQLLFQPQIPSPRDNTRWGEVGMDILPFTIACSGNHTRVVTIQYPHCLNTGKGKLYRRRWRHIMPVAIGQTKIVFRIKDIQYRCHQEKSD